MANALAPPVQNRLLDTALSSFLNWMQDPRRTQQAQGIGKAIQSALEGITQKDTEIQALQKKAFADPKNPLRVTDPEALAQLGDMMLSGPLSFAPAGHGLVGAKSAPMALFDTAGLPNRGKDLIQSKAEELASRLRSNGFKVDLQHSGSAAGPSSYLKVFDPETGRYFDDVRLSGHSKGVFNSQGVTNVASDAELNGVLEKAIGMRSLGKASGVIFQESLDAAAKALIDSGVKPKTAFRQARSILERNGTQFLK